MAIVDLGRGLVAIIDDQDSPRVTCHSWHATMRRDGKGYYAINSAGVRMHRLLLNAPEGQIVDHIDGDGLNNRRSNLRIGSQSQNCVNRRTTPGAYLRGARPKRGRWQGYIKFRGKQRSLGYFATEEEAHGAYVAEATQLHGGWMPIPEAPHAY